MTTIERFKAICHGEKPDYVPIFSFPGAPGMGGGCMENTWRRLVEGGMPEWVDGCLSLGQPFVTDTWQQYWGTLQPITANFIPAQPAKGFEQQNRVEGEFEIIECESGAITRQVIDNAITYSMPEYIEYPVRDRNSWEFYRERMTPGALWPQERIEEACEPYHDREKPLAVHLGGKLGRRQGEAVAALETLVQVFRDLHIRSFVSILVRVEGLEPPRLAAPEPKSGASASSATPAIPARTGRGVRRKSGAS